MKAQLKTFLLLLIILVNTPAILYSQTYLKPVVFYLQNLPYDRIGTMTDDAIIDSLARMDYLVIPIDCSSYPRTSPELEEELIKFHEQSPTILTQHYASSEIASLDIFYVPEGYILKRQIPIWNIKEHGADGSLARVMDTYNNEIVTKYKVAPVTNPDDMVDKYGRPIDYNLYMNITYPSGTPSEKVPLLMMFSASSSKQGSLNPVKTKQSTRYRNIFPLGFLTSGYAFAIVDHCYNPLAHDHIYSYFDRYTLDDQNGKASTTAYIRYLNQHANEYNLNGKYGVMGISKAAFSAVRAANKLNADGREHSLFNGIENTKPQPWDGYPSTVNVAYASAGNGTRRIPQYVDKNSVPMVTSAGLTDQYGHWDLYPPVVKHFKNIDNNHLAFWMEDLGHDYPCIGIDLATGISRYRLTKTYFESFLKPATASDPLKVFYVLPKENATDVDNRGKSRIMTSDDIIPKNMQGMTPYEPITVRFLSRINITSIQEKVKVYHKTSNTEIEGTWTTSMENTTFHFDPLEDMIKDDTYKIVVSAGLQNEAGQILQESFEREFTIRTIIDTPEPQLPTIQDAVFTDDFERTDFYKGGTPETNYNFTKQVISGSSPSDPSVSYTADHGTRLRIPNRKDGVGRVWVSGELSAYLPPFKRRLKDIEADSVVWTYNIRNNSSTEYAGFDDSQRAIATVIVATGSDFSQASGYAVAYGGLDYSKRFRLVKFTDGLDSNTKVEHILSSFGEMTTSLTGYYSIKISYTPETNTWRLYVRLDSSSGTYLDPITDSKAYTYIGSAVDDTYTNTIMSNFGFFLNYFGSGDYIQFYDNFTVRVFRTDTGTNLNKNQNDAYKIWNFKGGVAVEANNVLATLYDTRGVIIASKKISNIDKFESMSPGIYILKLQHGIERPTIQKIIIE